jgi:hypothetical protein
MITVLIWLLKLLYTFPNCIPDTCFHGPNNHITALNMQNCYFYSVDLLEQPAASIQSSSPVVCRPESLQNDDGGREVSKMLHFCSKLTTFHPRIIFIMLSWHVSLNSCMIFTLQHSVLHICRLVLPLPQHVCQATQYTSDVHVTVRALLIYSFKYNQQDATLYNIPYYCQCSTCFGRFLRLSSGA